ncbi:MAG: efflux RND transporter periplasmic adaptor subunit [Candidatus Binatia bacterium]
MTRYSATASLVAIVGAVVLVLAVHGPQPSGDALGADDSPAERAALPTAEGRVSALGRIQPDDGVIRVAGPSQPTVVIGQLLIDDNDAVRAGQPIAVLDTHAVSQARVAQLDAELRHAEAEWHRQETLRGQGIVSSSEYEARETRVAALRAERARAAAELDLTVVRSPVDGEVLQVHTRQGERVGPDGIAEIGQTMKMVVIAEVYETDIGKVRVGQPATISSPALKAPAHGSVARVGLKIGNKDVLSVDPAAKTDARVVEVEIRLDDARQVAGLTNLEVDVVIGP